MLLRGSLSLSEISMVLKTIFICFFFVFIFTNNGKNFFVGAPDTRFTFFYAPYK